MKYSLLLLAVLCAALSCHKSNDAQPDLVKETLTKGTWRVSACNLGSTDKTSDYTGYIFTFSSNGAVTAVKNSTTVSGSWTSAYVTNGSPYSSLVLTLTFSTPAEFAVISYGWIVRSRDETEIGMFRDYSNSDLLTLTKN